MFIMRCGGEGGGGRGGMYNVTGNDDCVGGEAVVWCAVLRCVLRGCKGVLTVTLTIEIVRVDHAGLVGCWMVKLS